jgi:uncharacterized membrane protein YkvA (DUF1232 family)
MVEYYEDIYQKMRKQVRDYAKSDKAKKNKWGEYLMLAPDLFHLLCRLSADPAVNIKDKAKLGAAIAYFVSPMDLVPEMILGPVGLLDDLALSAYVLNSILNNTDPEVIQRNWAGEGDILEIVKNIIGMADEMVGSGLVKKLKALISK